MKKPINEIISVREFAKRVGVVHQSIRKAIEEGHIVKGYSENKINYEIALKEWGNRPAAKSPQEKNKDQSQEFFEKEGISTITYTEANRRSAIFKAEKDELIVKELKGDLVRKKDVYKELFAVGEEIRAGLLSIPDKEIHNILACESRQEAHALLVKAITEVLESLSFTNVKL